MWRMKTTQKHFADCSNKKKVQREEFGYNFCEICNKNEMHSPVETHHIYFASRAPRHKELHNDRNTIILCRDHHRGLHNGNEMKEVFERLEEERELKDLFS